MHQHQKKINPQSKLHPLLRDLGVGKVIENVCSKSSDDELDDEKWRIAKVQQLRHYGVGFSCDVQTNPKNRELRVQPIQYEEQQAFVDGVHHFRGQRR